MRNPDRAGGIPRDACVLYKLGSITFIIGAEQYIKVILQDGGTVSVGNTAGPWACAVQSVLVPSF